MKERSRRTRWIRWIAVLAFVAAGPEVARAHCDGMDGPVVTAAQKALDTGNVNLVLIWVQKADEAQIKKSFERTVAVRQLSPQAEELADMYFFETLVRIHRAGEGAPYTGLKPAGRDLGPAIPAADKALESGSADALVRLLTDEVKQGIHERFRHAMAKRGYDKTDVAAGREYVAAYVSFVHHVEGLHQAAAAGGHGHGSAHTGPTHAD